jgi:hypothetical protein
LEAVARAEGRKGGGSGLPLPTIGHHQLLLRPALQGVVMTSFELLVLHERRSPSGRLYLSGKLNDATVIVYLDEDADVPEGAMATWRMLLRPTPSAPKIVSDQPTPAPARPKAPPTAAAMSTDRFRRSVLNDDVPL